MTATAKSPQHVIALKAENFKRLVAVAVHPHATGVQEITGRNGQGKSSLIDAIQAALGGKKLSPEMPVRVGAEEAVIILETEELRVYRRISATGEHFLTVEPVSGSGAKFKKPQQMLDELLGGGIGFDPMEFVRMKDKEQADRIRAIVKLDTGDLDGEREKVFSERTALHREAENLKAKLRGEPDPEIVAAPPAPIDLSDLTARFVHATQAKAENNRRRSILADWRGQRVKIEDDIAKLKLQMAEWERSHEVVMDKILKGQKIVDGLIDPDVDALHREIAAANQENVKRHREAEVYRSAVAQENKVTLLADELRRKEVVIAHQTSRLTEIDDAKRARIAAVKMPVDGLAIEDGCVALNGVPIKQISSSQQIRLSLAIAAGLNPTIRCVLVRDGSLLDDAARANLHEWAVEQDMQVFLEVVGDGPHGITIHEGRVGA